MDERRGRLSDPGALPGEDTAYRDPKVRRRALAGIRRSLWPRLGPGERVQGMFAVYRLRRSVTTLVITNQRLITLGEAHVGLPIVDDVRRDDVVEVHAEREKVFGTGAVTARTHDGPVSLGTLDYSPDTFHFFDEVLARDVGHGLPLIPVPGADRVGPEVRDDPPDQDHPLVAQLRALADLHQRGALSDAEFAAAKARVLGGSPDRQP